MQSFEHFDALFMIDKSIERGKLLLIFPSLFKSMLVGILGKLRSQEKEKQIAPLSRHFHGLH